MDSSISEAAAVKTEATKNIVKKNKTFNLGIISSNKNEIFY